MTAYMNSATLDVGTNIENIASVVAFAQQWHTWASTCSLSSRPGNCTLNVSAPLAFYEGGYAVQGLPNVYSTDHTNTKGELIQSITSATNASTAVLAVANNGCVAGQTVALSSLSGGTWSSAAGSYTVQASGIDTNHCAINLSSTNFGTLSSATLTYTGSANYVNNLRQASYTAPELDTLTTTVYNDVIANGGINPSQFYMGNAGSLSYPWFVWAFDIYGYYPLGQCSSCTIASSTLTLGGTITGVFRVGDTLLGGGVTGIGTGAGSNTTITSCTRVGSGPCGTNAGDTLGLSQASTVGIITPAVGNTAIGGTTVRVGSCTGVAQNYTVYDITTGNTVSGVGGTCSSGSIPLYPNATSAVTSGDSLSIGPAMTGNATPPANAAGNSTTSPVRSWGAICRFNGNGSQCNG